MVAHATDSLRFIPPLYCELKRSLSYSFKPTSASLLLAASVMRSLGTPLMAAYFYMKNARSHVSANKFKYLLFYFAKRIIFTYQFNMFPSCHVHEMSIKLRAISYASPGFLRLIGNTETCEGGITASRREFSGKHGHGGCFPYKCRRHKFIA